MLTRLSPCGRGARVEEDEPHRPGTGRDRASDSQLFHVDDYDLVAVGARDEGGCPIRGVADVGLVPAQLDARYGRSRSTVEYHQGRTLEVGDQRVGATRLKG